MQLVASSNPTFTVGSPAEKLSNHPGCSVCLSGAAAAEPRQAPQATVPASRNGIVGKQRKQKHRGPDSEGAHFGAFEQYGSRCLLAVWRQGVWGASRRLGERESAG